MPKKPKDWVNVIRPDQPYSDPTSVKRAIKLIARGQAKYIDEHTIEMIPADYRYDSSPDGKASLVTSPTPNLVYEYEGPENLRTYDTYPHKRTFGR